MTPPGSVESQGMLFLLSETPNKVTSKHSPEGEPQVLLPRKVADTLERLQHLEYLQLAGVCEAYL